MEIKQGFHSQDKLEIFKDALNIQAKLYCNVDNAFDLEKAADYLQQLTKSWRMAEDDVITTMVNNVKDILDKQSRMYVLRFLDIMRIPYSKEQIKERWRSLSAEDKREVTEGIISYLRSVKEGGKN